MSTHKYIDKICCIALILSLIFSVLFMNADFFGIVESSKMMGYETPLFDTSIVHTIDIVMDDWDSFIATCTNEEYALCSVVIDNQVYKNVGIRAKGNTSLMQVANYENNRYSFKIEFDQYDSTKSYYGLDKLSLNNIIQDNTYMKDYLCYQMMYQFGVDAPLCSYVNITVNGEDWGLYLAVEGIEEAFLERNYGSDYGKLYKPDSMSMGGGRGNGEEYKMPADGEKPQMPKGERSISDNFQDKEMPDKGGPGGGMGSDDVKLIYSDDEYASYTNIFDNAKTDITNADKDRLIESLKQLNSGENLSEVVDIDEVIRYFVVHNFVCNFDSYTGSMIHNYYLYEEDGQLSMIPWDYNLAFGGFQGADDATTLVNYPIDSPVSGGTVDSRPMLAWIFSNEEYTELYHKYFVEFISTYFDSGFFSETIDSVKEMIAPFVENDKTKFCTYEEFQKGIDTLKEFCLLRAKSISGQLNGTIASTSDGQMQNSNSLVDASHINISDMGSMGNGKGGGMDKPNSQNDVWDKIPQNAFPSPPNGQQGNDMPPDMPQDGQQNGDTSISLPDKMQSDTVQAMAPNGDQSFGTLQNREHNEVNPAPNDRRSEMDLVNAQMISLETWIMIGISCFVLVVAILIAVGYKRHI